MRHGSLEHLASSELRSLATPRSSTCPVDVHCSQGDETCWRDKIKETSPNKPVSSIIPRKYPKPGLSGHLSHPPVAQRLHRPRLRYLFEEKGLNLLHILFPPFVLRPACDQRLFCTLPTRCCRSNYSHGRLATKTRCGFGAWHVIWSSGSSLSQSCVRTPAAWPAGTFCRTCC